MVLQVVAFFTPAGKQSIAPWFLGRESTSLTLPESTSENLPLALFKQRLLLDAVNARGIPPDAA